MVCSLRFRLESKKVFVGGLAPTVTETEFREYFEAYGPVKEAIVMYDRQTNRSRGFGFITFDTEVRHPEALFCCLLPGVLLRYGAGFSCLFLYIVSLCVFQQHHHSPWAGTCRNRST